MKLAVQKTFGGKILNPSKKRRLYLFFQTTHSNDPDSMQVELKRLENSLTSCDRCSQHLESLNVISSGFLNFLFF